MVSYRITERDLTAATFGVSVLSETTLSLRAVWRPEVYPHMAPWRRAIEVRLQQVDLEMLLALVAADYSTPEFLNPRPVASTTDFGGELATVAQSSARVVDRDLDGRDDVVVGVPGKSDDLGRVVFLGATGTGLGGADRNSDQLSGFGYAERLDARYGTALA